MDCIFELALEAYSFFSLTPDVTNSVNPDKKKDITDGSPSLVDRILYNWQQSMLLAAVAICVIGFANAFFSGMILPLLAYGTVGLICLIAAFYFQDYPSLLNLRTQVEALTTQIEEGQKQIDQRQKQLTQSQLELSQFQEVRTQLQEQVDKLETERQLFLNDVLARNTLLDTALGARCQQYEQENNRLLKTTTQLGAIEEKLSQVQENITKERTELEKIREEVKNRMSELQKINNQIQESTQLNTNSSFQLNALTHQLTRQTSGLSSSSSSSLSPSPTDLTHMHD